MENSSIDKLIASSIEQGKSFEFIEKLINLQEKQAEKAARLEYIAAIGVFKTDSHKILKNTTGYGYNYADLASILEHVNPKLSELGLYVSWVTDQDGDKITVHCDITHISGYAHRVSLSSHPDSSVGKNAVQAIGSTVTYLQRYTLMSALGLAASGQDTDGVTETKITDAQAKELKQLIEETGSDTKLFLKACGGYASVDDLPSSKYAIAHKKLLQKKDKANATAK